MYCVQKGPECKRKGFVLRLVDGASESYKLVTWNGQWTTDETK